MTRARRIAALILAAGASRRLGRPKQLLALDGTPLVRLAVERASESHCDGVFVVVGAHRERVLAALAGLEIELVENSSWERGIGGSIHAGVRALDGSSTPYSAVLIMTVDQYRVSPLHLNRLCEHYDAGHDVVASRYSGTVGIPALFGESYFPALRTLEQGQGAKAILRADLDSVFSVSCPEAGFDLDTLADLERFNRQTSA